MTQVRVSFCDWLLPVSTRASISRRAGEPRMTRGFKRLTPKVLCHSVLRKRFVASSCLSGFISVFVMKTPSEDVPASAQPQPGEQACPCEPPPLPNIECVDRVKKLPIVEAAWNQSAAIYNNVKGYNPVLTWTLDTAEATVNKAMEQTLPVVAPIVKKLETPIGMVDKTLCKGLDVVENAVPCVKQQPAQIAESAKSLCDPAYKQVKSLQELSWVTANQFLNTNVGNVIVSQVDNLSSTVDKILDFILPPGEPLGVPRAEKVMQALMTIGGLPHRAASHGYATICNILQAAGQQDLRQNLRAILTLLHIQNLSSSVCPDDSVSSPSTSTNSNESPSAQPQEVR